MASLSSITLPNNNTYNLHDDEMTYNRIISLQSKTYTGVVAAANTDPNGWYYFGTINPTDYNTPWKIRYRIRSTIAGLSANQYGLYDVQFVGCYNTYHQYDIYNSHNTSYRSHYGHVVYFATQAGINSNYGHLLGLRLQSSYNSTTAANARTFEIEILETLNCTFTFFDNFTLFANVPGTGTTNYVARFLFDGTTNGHRMLGDNNDANYQNRIYYGRFKTYAPSYRYVIFLQKNDLYLLPVNSVDNQPDSTSKAITTESFDPFGYIFYWNSTTNYIANAYIGDGALYNQHNTLNLGYSFNTAATLVSRDPIYLVADIQSDGSAKLASTPLAFSLPTTLDGHIYIFLGKAINTINIELYPYHPVYWYKGGRVRYFTKSDLNNNGALWQYNSSTDSVELIFPN